MVRAGGRACIRRRKPSLEKLLMSFFDRQTALGNCHDVYCTRLPHDPIADTGDW